ncbi:hypothetical protein Cgig2_011292 [Carnegiea gigantea]|uniref:DUF4283 domain-containing protein n=1 Tax=Carnegiea gigantea TaxID=171969 RepID=A0A9Q1GX67_9CARY|nr:hypothetical protein Cgig2_011292 [Carnegiea gigantea]
MIVSGVKYVKIDKVAVESEIAYWKQAILYCVLGANPPFDVIKEFTTRIWKLYAIDKVAMVRKGMSMVKFKHIEDKLAFVQKGVYLFDSKPFLGLNNLSKIQSLLGISIKTDKYTKEKSIIQYAWVLIEVSLEGPFPNSVEFNGGHGDNECGKKNKMILTPFCMMEIELEAQRSLTWKSRFHRVHNSFSAARNQEWWSFLMDK